MIIQHVLVLLRQKQEIMKSFREPMAQCLKIYHSGVLNVKKEHLGNNYPNRKPKQETQSLLTGVSCLTLHDSEPVKQIIPQSWILLDKCTSKSVSNNESMVTYITDCDHDEEICCTPMVV